MAGGWEVGRTDVYVGEDEALVVRCVRLCSFPPSVCFTTGGALRLWVCTVRERAFMYSSRRGGSARGKESETKGEGHEDASTVYTYIHRYVYVHVVLFISLWGKKG